MKRRTLFAAMALGLASSVGICALGCAEPGTPVNIPSGLTSPFTGYKSARYGDARYWLCRPDHPGGPCSGDLTTTELLPDGGTRIVNHPIPKDPGVDCFYVYPTVDMGLGAKNHSDFSDLKPESRTAAAQIAQFSTVCSVYAPLYRQVTIGTYLTWASRRDRFLATAFSDVEDAFLHYMANDNHGRPVVLVGHSQGAEMVMRLLQKRFDGDPAMKARLVAGLVIGGKLEVAPGKRTGGSLATIPTCERPEEAHCVIGYRSFIGGEAVSGGAAEPDEGRATVCVNPVDPETNHLSRLSGAVVPYNEDSRKYFPGVRVSTPFVEIPDFYAARCVSNERSFHYLEIFAAPKPGDVRKNPVDFDSLLWHSSLGLHVLDFQLPQRDLVDLVGKKVAAFR